MFIKSVYPVKDVFINYFSHIYSNNTLFGEHFFGEQISQGLRILIPEKGLD